MFIIILLTSILRTSLGVFPSTLMPLTSHTSSPTWMSPDRSAAPPCIIRAITIFPVSSSVFIVAPWQRNTFQDNNFKHMLQSLIKLWTLYQRLVPTLEDYVNSISVELFVTEKAIQRNEMWWRPYLNLGSMAFMLYSVWRYAYRTHVCTVTGMQHTANKGI